VGLTVVILTRVPQIIGTDRSICEEFAILPIRQKSHNSTADLAVASMIYFKYHLNLTYEDSNRAMGELIRHQDS
jgi:hypothetical protein